MGYLSSTSWFFPRLDPLRNRKRQTMRSVYIMWTLHIFYYNPFKCAAEREQLEKRIDKYKEFIRKDEGTDQKFEKTYLVQSSEAMSAKLFLEFTTLIVRNRMYNLLKEEMLRIETNPYYLTVPAAIRELEKIEIVRYNDEKYKLVHTVTKKQKDILAAFGMNTEYVIQISWASRIA